MKTNHNILIFPALLLLPAMFFAVIFLINYFSGNELLDEVVENPRAWALAMIISSVFVGILSYYFSSKLNFYTDKIKKADENIEFVRINNAKRVIDFEKEIFDLKECIVKKDEFYKNMSNLGDSSVKHLTELISDYRLIQYDISARYLKYKKHPATGEAKRIEILKKETKVYIEQYKQMLYKYEALMGLFPELSTYVDDFESIRELNNFKSIEGLTDEYDRTRDYLSKEEYNKLSDDKKNQLALDNYIKWNKSKWQIGRDYEMYISYLYRKEGWAVNHFGIEKRLEDMGRDLIVYGDNKILIVQCKYWSEKKLIHEKHIAQLYGSTIEFALSQNELFQKTVEPVFVTNIELSETAKRFASKLNVRVHKIEMKDFPRIKCNLNNGEKIYHLPFDQQYDCTKIENKGEFYAYTVEEATKVGFRRAFKHFI